MQQQVDPDTLDEIYWRSQPLLDFYGGNLNVNNVLHYFYSSPFSLVTSNNSIIFNQAKYNQQIAVISWDRNLLEKSLNKMKGEEYRLIYPPPLPELPPNANPAQIQQHQASIPAFRPNFFVIRRQTRYAEGPDDVRPKADYFIVNGNIYQAPLLEKVVGNRTLAISRALRDTEKVVRELRELRDSQSASTATTAASTQLTTTTTAPSTQATSTQQQSQASVTLRTQKKAIEKTNKETFLSFSLNTAMKFSEDYLDSTDTPHKPKDTLAAAQAQQKALDAAGKKKEDEKAEEAKRDATPVAAGGGIGGGTTMTQQQQGGTQQGGGVPTPQMPPKKVRKKSKANINPNPMMNGQGGQGGQGGGPDQGKSTVTVGR